MDQHKPDNSEATVPQDVERELAEEHEHAGGGRFNRRPFYIAAGVLITVAVIGMYGIRSVGTATDAASALRIDDAGDTARDKAEDEELAAAAVHPAPAAPVPLQVATIPPARPQIASRASRVPSRYAQWAEDKYMRALEAPQMVAAFHAGGTLELSKERGAEGDSGPATGIGASDTNLILHPPAAPYTVMAGSVIPAMLISGINSDLGGGQVLAQVSENVFDSATGKSLLIPQGSRLIGVYGNASTYGQQRVSIAFRRLIFPDTSSMDLPQMPGVDQAGYAGVTDQVNNHYLATFGTAAVTSLISAGQMVGQMAAFGGGTYGAYGYYQPNQWAMAGETAGSAASAQMGSMGQQMVGNGLNRPATIEVRPGYEFNVMVTADLVFPSAYKG